MATDEGFLFIRNDCLAHYPIYYLTYVLVLTNTEVWLKFIYTTWHVSLLVNHMSRQEVFFLLRLRSVNPQFEEHINKVLI